MDGISLNVDARQGAPNPNPDEPKVGDIYQPRAGQPGYWWIIGITKGEYHHTAIYLVFNLHGEITGAQRAGMRYLGERNKVGYAEIPPINPEWF